MVFIPQYTQRAMKEVLRPKQETFEIEGKLSYGEGNRAWNTIWLKRDLLKEFPQLKERRKKFNYKMVMHRSFKELKRDINKMDKEGEVIPLLLWFIRI